MENGTGADSSEASRRRAEYKGGSGGNKTEKQKGARFAGGIKRRFRSERKTE